MIEELERLMLERCSTAREAIRLTDELTRKYGYRDYGECLTISDPKEVWHFEIMGATPKHSGAVWAAVRIPDDHVGVPANVSRIDELHLDRPDDYMASENVYSLAEEMGWWDAKDGGTFKFHKAYGGSSPKRIPIREWRVLSLAAPSLNLKPIPDELPFKESGCQPVAFAGPETVAERPESERRHQLLHRRQQQLLLLNRYPIQKLASRSCRRNVWLGFDNPAHSARMPLFAGISDVPPSFKIDNQHGYNNGSTTWVFRRVSRLANARWGKARELVMRAINAGEARAFSELPGVEKRALELFAQDPKNARALLTAYSSAFARATTQRYWGLGDTLWTLFTYDYLDPEDLERLK